MNITIALNTSDLPGYFIEGLGKLGQLSILKINNMSESDALQIIPLDTEILICHRNALPYISDILLSGLPKLQHIAVCAVGIERINYNIANQKDITISNAKGCNSKAVAQHIRAMILHISKKISHAQKAITQSGKIDINQLQGIELYNKTIGIIGLGEIGSRVAKIAESFDMQIIGVDPIIQSQGSIQHTSLTNLIRKSDVIVICAPLTVQTQNMIDTSQIQQMKDGVIIVNCAREQIVNKQAIMNAVTQKKVYGYGVETDNTTTLKPSDQYLTHPNILVTPHIAWNTPETLTNTYHTVLKNIGTYIDNL